MNVQTQTHALTPSPQAMALEISVKPAYLFEVDAKPDRSTAGKILQARLRELTASFGL